MLHPCLCPVRVLYRGPAELLSGLPLVQRSYLGVLLPESLLHMLESYGPGVFGAALSGDHNTPEIVWTAAMRQQRLIPAMLQVLYGVRCSTAAVIDFQCSEFSAPSACDSAFWP